MIFSDLLKLLPIIGSVTAKAPEFIGWWESVTSALHPKDQATAKAALADIQAGNDEGHARLQEKLRAVGA